MQDGDQGPSAGLAALGIGVMALCCLGPVVLAAAGTTGLAALVTENAWWLLGGCIVLAGAVLAARIRRRDGRPVTGSCVEEKGIAHE